MAIKIQQYQESENINPVAPPAPSISQPSSAAFGVQEAQAAGQMGEQVTKLGTVLANHMVEQAKWDAEQSAYDAVNRLRQEGTNILYGTDTVRRKYGDQEFDVSSGVMNRKLSQAQDALIDFNERFSPTREKIAQGLGSAHAQRLFMRQASTLEQAYQSAVVKHQATQRNSAIQGEFEGALKNAAKDAGAIATADQWKAFLAMPGGINETAAKLGAFKGEGPEAVEATRRKYIYQALDNAASNALTATGDISQARALLDAAKEDVSADDYNTIDDKLTRLNERLQNDVTQATRFAKTAVEMDIVSKVAEGEILSKSDLDKFAYDESGKPVVGREFYQSQLKFITQPRKFTEAEKFSAESELLDLYYGLNPSRTAEDKASGGLGVVLSKNLDSPEAILAFRERLNELAPRLDASVRRSFMKRTEEAYQKAKANPEEFKKDHGMVANALRFIWNQSATGLAVNSPRHARDAANAFITFMDGKKPTPENLSSGLKQAFREASAASAPATLLRESTPNHTVSGPGGRISFTSPLPAEENPDQASKPEMIRVRVKSTGQTGSIPKEKYDSSIFDLA